MKRARCAAYAAGWACMALAVWGAEGERGVEAPSGTVSASPLVVRVVGGRAGVFAATNVAKEAVAWVSPGAELTVRGEYPDEGVWIGVEAPEAVSVWIYRELVREGEVVAEKSRVRTGAGLGFQTVGSLARGERVSVLGSYGDWLRIRPPSGLRFWVLRDQVEPLAEPAAPEGVAEAAVTAEGAVQAEGEVSPDVQEVRGRAVAQEGQAGGVGVAPPPELRGWDLEDGAGQGERVRLAGVLDWGGVGGVGAPYGLVAWQAEGGTGPVCHLYVPGEGVGGLVGAQVEVEGTRWRVRGVALPVVVAASVRSAE